MQCKEETELTFQLCDLDDVENFVNMAKDEAIDIASSCGMNLESYEDSFLLGDVVHILPNVVDEDDEDEEDVENEPPSSVSTEVDPIVIQEDLGNLRVQKSSRPGLPTYELTVEKGSNTSKSIPFKKENDVHLSLATIDTFGNLRPYTHCRKAFHYPTIDYYVYDRSSRHIFTIRGIIWSILRIV